MIEQSLIDEIVRLWRDRLRAKRREGDEARYLLSRCQEICRQDHAEEWRRCVVLRETKKMPKLTADAKKLRGHLVALRPVRIEHPRILETVAIDPDFVHQFNWWREKVKAIEKHLAPLAGSLPVWTEWAEKVPGLGAISVAGILAECPHIGELDAPQKMNKRFGLAVADGKRQRNTRVEGACGHGYAPRRKSLVWNTARTLVQNTSPYLEVYRREWRKWTEFGADGTPVVKAGPPDAVWLTETATKGRPNRYNHALGVVAKQMLVDYWRVWHGKGCRPTYRPTEDLAAMKGATE